MAGKFDKNESQLMLYSHRPLYKSCDFIFLRGQRSCRQRDAPMGMHSICDDVSTHKRDVVCTGVSNGQRTAEVGDQGLPLRLLI